MVDAEVFENVDFRVQSHEAEYDECRFTNCSFSQMDLSDTVFLDCRFEGCDFSMANISNVAFREVIFKDCKLVGLDFSVCNTFLLSLSFKGCQLNLASFYQLKLNKINFKRCDLKEVDFTNADLSNSLFKDCDLSLAIFENTMLEGADLYSSYGYAMDPENNYIKKAKFSADQVIGLLTKYDIEIM